MMRLPGLRISRSGQIGPICRADVDLPDYDDRCPRPRLCSMESPRTVMPAESPTRRIEIPAGEFEMKMRHERRECGCYPLGATDDAMWGWFYKDTIEHALRNS